MKKEKKIYCWKCGKLNTLPQKKCYFCNAKLKKKDFSLCKWLCGQTFDELKGHFIDKVYFIVTNAIKLHLYGGIVIITIAFTATSTVFHYQTNNNTKIKETNKEYSVSQYTQIVDISCEDGFTLENNSCIKEETISAKEELTCESGYYLNNNNCYSNETTPINVEYYCTQTLAEYRSYYGHNPPMNEGLPEDWYDREPIEFIEVDMLENNRCGYVVCIEFNVYDVCAHYWGPHYVDAAKKESCPSGKVKFNGACHTTTKPNKIYTCPDDYELKDKTCQKEIIHDVVITKTNKGK